MNNFRGQIKVLPLITTSIIFFPTLAHAEAAKMSAAPQGLEEIVVTAQKREQNLQSVPVAVTAITSSTLQAVRFQNMLNLNSVSPGLSLRPSPGGTQGVWASMRGIYGVSAIGQDQGVAVYIDGVPINGVYGAAFDVAEVERIEVLRGPQGTLFGRNSLGGAINIITKDPTGQFGARQELTYGNYNQFRSKTHVELPAWGPLSASVTYLHNERRGDIRNLGAGTVWDYTTATQGAFGKLTSPKYLGDQDVNSVSAALKLEASTDLTFVYKFNWTENNYTPSGVGIAGIDSNNATGRTILGVLAAQPNPSSFAPNLDRPDALNNAFAVPSYLRTYDHNLTTTFRLNDNIRFKNILAYRKRLVFSSDQLDGLGGLTMGGAPYVALVSTSRYDDTQWSDEFQTNIKTEWFDLTAGYLHYQVRAFGGNKPGTAASFSFRTLPGFVIPFTGLQPSDQKSVSDAVFVQAEFHLNSKLDLVLGSRLTSDRKTGFDRTFAGLVRPIQYKGSKPTYLAGVNYKPADPILVYAKVSTGYISGGQLSTLTYDASTATSYEGGLKADWLDRRLRTNLAVYHTDYKQLQFLATGAAFGIQANQVIFNGGDARANGAEFETTLVPVTGVTLSGNVSYTDMKYTKVNAIFASAGTFYPLYIPKWTSAVSAQYQSGEIFGGAHLLIRGDAIYTSRQYKGRFNTAQAPGYFATSFAPAALIVNTRVSLAGFRLSGTQVEIAAWARNLTDNRARIGGTDATFLNTAIYQPARTFGLDLNFDL